MCLFDKSVNCISSHSRIDISWNGQHFKAEEALKGTPLANAKIYMAGTASTYKDWVDGSTYDTYNLLIAGVASLFLIFIIMLT